MKKSELEAEIKRLNRSVGWYSGAYYRLKESEALAQQRIESLEEESESLETQIRIAELKQTREQAAATRAHKARQAELLKEQLKVTQQQIGPPPYVEGDESVEGRLARCQKTNAELREKISQLKEQISGYSK